MIAFQICNGYFFFKCILLCPLICKPFYLPPAGNLHRIKFALSFGARKLKDIFRLPGQRMGAALERFFMNTLNRNGKGQRPDIDFPVPAFGTERFVEPVLYGDSDSFYGGIRYVQSGRNYGAPPPPLPGSPTSPSQADTLALQAHQNWSMLYQRGTNVYAPKQAHYPPNSNASHAPYSLEEAGKSRGTGPYIPDMVYFFHYLYIYLYCNTSLYHPWNG